MENRPIYILIPVLVIALALVTCAEFTPGPLPPEGPEMVPWQEPAATATRVAFKNDPLGLGLCHEPVQDASYYTGVEWGYNTTTWLEVEGAADNDFDWSAIDAVVNNTPSGKCNVLQILINADTFASIPTWARDEALAMPRIDDSESYINVLMGGDFCNDNTDPGQYPYFDHREDPNQAECAWGWVVFDSWMLDQLDDLMMAMADRYDNDSRVCGVLVNVGPYGEMTHPNPYKDDPNNYQTPFTDTSSLYVQYLARAFKVPPYAVVEDYTGYQSGFHYFYQMYVKQILDVYLKHWRSTPVLLQIGSGGLTNFMVDGGALYEVLDYGLHQYPGAVWYKQNGWMNNDSYIGIFNMIVNAANNNWGGKYGAPVGWENGNFWMFDPANATRWYKTTNTCSYCARPSFACVGDTIYGYGESRVFYDVRHNPAIHGGTVVATPNPSYSWNTLKSQLEYNWNAYWQSYVDAGNRELPDVARPTLTPTDTFTPRSVNTPTPTPTGPTPTFTHTATTDPNATATFTPTPTSSYTPGPTSTPTPTATTSGTGTTLYPTWDTYIDQYAPTTSYSGVSPIKQYGDDRHRVLMKFDLSSIPDYSTINSAQLQLYAISGSGTEVTVRRLLREATQNATWYTLDGSTSWYTPGALGSEDQSSSYGTASLAGAWNNINIGSLVQEWVNKTYYNFGLILDGTGGTGYVNITSLEGDSATRPRLVIDYTAPTATPTGAPTATPTTAPTWTPVVATVVASSNWDTYINASSPDASYDTNTKLYVKENYTWESLIRPWSFATVVPANSTIYSATLNLRHYYCSAYPVTIDLHRVRKDVDIVDTTYNDASATESWTTAGAKDASDIALVAEATVAVDSGNAWHAWPMTNIAQRWTDGLSAQYGVLLRSDDAGTDYCDFASGDNATTGDRPYFYFKFDPPTPTPTLTPTPDFRLALGIERVVNTSFELRSAADFEGWTEVQGDGTVGASTSASHWGATSARLVAGTTNRAYIYQNILVSELTDYALAFWNYGDGTNDGGYRVNDYTQSGTIVNFTSTGHTGTTWKVFYVPFTTPAGCQEIRILFYSPAAGSGGQTRFDDISLIQTSGSYVPTVQPGDVITHTIFITNPSSLSDVQLTSRYTSSDPKPSPLGATPPATWDDTWDTWRWYTLTVDATPQHFSSIWQVSDRGETVATERGMSQVQHDSTYWITATADAQYWVATHTPTYTPFPTSTPTSTPTATHTPTATPTPIDDTILINEVLALPAQGQDYAGALDLVDNGFIEILSTEADSVDLSTGRLVVEGVGLATQSYYIPYPALIAPDDFKVFYVRDIGLSLVHTDTITISLKTWTFSEAAGWYLETLDSVALPAAQEGKSYARAYNAAPWWVWNDAPSPGY